MKELMKSNPDCYGKFLKVNKRDCNTCPVRLDCYGIFKENETREEELKNRRKISWYKCDIKKLNICDTCG